MKGQGIKAAFFLIAATRLFAAGNGLSKPLLVLRSEIPEKSSYCLGDFLQADELLQSKLALHCGIKAAGSSIDRKSAEIFLLQAGIFPFRLSGEMTRISKEGSVSVSGSIKTPGKTSELMSEEDRQNWPRLKPGAMVDIISITPAFEIKLQAKLVSQKSNDVLVVERGGVRMQARRSGPHKAVITGADGKK